VVVQLAAGARWVAFALGLLLVLTTWLSAIGTLIVPRPISSRIAHFSGTLTKGTLTLVCRPVHNYILRDRILAWAAPLSLFTRLVVWVALFDLGYALMLMPFVHGRVAKGFDEAGSGLFTLGYAAPSHVGGTALVYIAAFSGLVVVALQIGYLPTLYAAFNRREAEVTLLVARAGEPAWGPEFLARTRFGLGQIDSSGELSQLYRVWERWAADVAETHSTYTTLCWLRSPRPNANWLISLLSVMDGAALQLVLSPSLVPTLDARLALRAGFTCLDQIAAAIGLPVVSDPDPDSPIQLSYAEFADAVSMLRTVGYPVETTTEQAWPHFRGWRVNYESVAYALAWSIDAPPAMWSGPRRWPATVIPPYRPQNRVASDTDPDDPQQPPRRPSGAALKKD
jgi:hypothetical protein